MGRTEVYRPQVSAIFGGKLVIACKKCGMEMVDFGLRCPTCDPSFGELAKRDYCNDSYVIIFSGNEIIFSDFHQCQTKVATAQAE